jgi:hypothetical protein
MPGSAQWTLHENPYDATGRCWIDEQWIHSLIFWTPSIAVLASDYTLPRFATYREKIAKQIKKYYPTLEPIRTGDGAEMTKAERKQWNAHLMYEETPERPLICCEFTNWKPTRMLRIEEYCHSLQSEITRENLDLFDYMRSQGFIANAPHKDVAKLDPYDLEKFVAQRGKMLKQYRQEWFETIAGELRYKRPNVVNGQHLGQLASLKQEPLFVFPCFMKPGRQNYVIVQENGIAN